MNKKIIPLLLALPLIAGCNNVSKPGFKKAGEKLGIERFMEEVAKYTEKNIFTKNREEGEHMPSYVASSIGSTFEKEVTKRGKQTLSTEKANRKNSLKFSSDAKHGVAKRVQKMEQKEDAKGTSDKASVVYKSANTYVTQKLVEGGDEYLITVNQKEKSYSVNASDKATSTSTYADKFDNAGAIVLATPISVYQSLITSYYQASEEDKANYSFYQNKAVFTIELKIDKTDEEAKVSQKSLKKVQVDLSKDTAIKYTYWTESKVTREALEDDGNTLKGDTITTTLKTAMVVKASKKNVSLKSVKLDKYSKYSYDI